MSARTKLRVPQALAGLGLMSAAGLAGAAYDLNLRPGVTPISREVFDLHMLILWVCIIIGIVVFGAMFYSIIRHRKSKGAVAAKFHESTTVEILWTIVPFLILIGMAIPATKTLIAMEDTRNSDVSIKVTGYQWKWQYDYLDDGVSFFSTLSTPKEEIYDRADKNPNYLLEVDNPVVVPVNRKVRLLITSNDVIHAWWVPDLGMKKDAIPGFVNEMWFSADTPGTYRGQCAELCGKEHAYMPIHVKVLSQADYSAWVDGKKKAMAALADDPTKEWQLAELIARGEKVYNANCAACHQASGMGAGPIKPLVGSAIVLDADKGKQIATLLNGAANGAMPAWKQLSDTELAAVITYTKNSWTNKTGQIVQPKEVVAARK